MKTKMNAVLNGKPVQATARPEETALQKQAWEIRFNALQISTAVNKYTKEQTQERHEILQRLLRNLQHELDAMNKMTAAQ